VAWWLVLAHQSRKVAQEESNRQTHLLVREIAPGVTVGYSATPVRTMS
jgi:hypothetical protein